MAESDPVTTILLVEDERVTRHRIQKVLAEAGHRVTAVSSASEALTELGKTTFDLMLLDVWLPEMNGIELLSRLEPGKARPRVIVITADDTSKTLLDAVRADAYQLVTKPIEPDELLATVERALRGSRATPPIRVLSAKPNWVELAVPCDRESAERIQGFLSRLDADLDPVVREAIGRVFREMLLNAVEWGGKLDPSREVRVTYLRAKKMVLYRIADPGEGFRFEEIGHAAVTNTDESPIAHVIAREEKGLRPGGFGILMSQTLADELLYNEAQNEVVFVKYLED
jgi:DNA-binding response OmpR family regulator